MRFTSKALLNFYCIKLRDYSEYKSTTCHNGGDYAFGDTLINNFDGSFTRVPYTSGEFCPKCGSWDCCGDCQGDETISSVNALLLINHYIDNGHSVSFT